MTHLLSFPLFIHLFHTKSQLLIETTLLRSYVFTGVYISQDEWRGKGYSSI